ncbi:MAG: hypothetical protein K8S15_00175 [Candidatus Aegiribacteria sp.]|nr:hypothetical protein [Candidatus Aegiribacteria sp.]
MKYVISAFVILVLFSCCGYDSGNTAPGESAGADTLHYLVPYDSIGIDAGDSRYVFGDVLECRVFPDGSIGVLDWSITTVKFYTPEGEYIRKFNPEGTRSGQFRGLNRLDCDDSGIIMLADLFGGKLAWFNSEFSLIEEVVFTSQEGISPRCVYSVPDMGFVGFLPVFREPDSAGCEIALFRGSDEPEIIYRRKIALFDPCGNYQKATIMVFTADQNGRVYISDRSEETFSIACYSPEGDTLYCIDHDYEPVRRSQEDIDSSLELASQNWIDRTGNDEGFNLEPTEYHPAVHTMMVDGTGRLWVKGGGVDTLYHIFSDTGEFMYDCMLVMPDWQETSGWAVNIGPYGVVANTSNPERYPVVYMLEEVTEVVPLSE